MSEPTAADPGTRPDRSQDTPADEAESRAAVAYAQEMLPPPRGWDIPPTEWVALCLQLREVKAREKQAAALAEIATAATEIARWSWQYGNQPS